VFGDFVWTTPTPPTGSTTYTQGVRDFVFSVTSDPVLSSGIVVQGDLSFNNTSGVVIPCVFQAFGTYVYPTSGNGSQGGSLALTPPGGDLLGLLGGPLIGSKTVNFSMPVGFSTIQIIVSGSCTNGAGGTMGWTGAFSVI